MKKYRCVPEGELLDMLAELHEFHALISGGVDNWSWYGDSCRDYIRAWRDRKRLDPTADWTFEHIAAQDVCEYPSTEF